MLQIDPDRILSAHPRAKELLRRLEDAGYRAVIVGGAVRDLLRGLYHEDFAFKPEDVDIDIATSAGPDEIKQIFTDYDFVEVGKSFGVLVLVSPEGEEYEVAQFRTESEYDGRKPGEVEPANSLLEDVKRRDFTVNGMALGLDGRVIDHVGGLQDLKEKKVTAIGNPLERFKEDYLRPLRAIRITCDLNGRLDPDTEKAIERVATRITDISWERIREEIFNILATPNSEEGMRMLKEKGILVEILPEMASNEGVPQPEEYHPEGDVLEHSFRALGVGDRFGFRPIIKLAIFLHDVGKAAAFERNDGEHLGGHAQKSERLTRKIASRLRLSNEEENKLAWLAKNHMRGSILPDMRKAKQVQLVRYNQDETCSLGEVSDRFEYFTDLLRVIMADSEASAHEVEGWLPVLERFTSLLPHLKALEELGSARKLINGDDLLELGMEEGPELGEVLDEIHENIYSGEVQDREEAIELAERLIKNSS